MSATESSNLDTQPTAAVEGKPTFLRRIRVQTISVAEWLDGFIERNPWRCAGVFVSIFFAAQLARAAKSLLWTDEIATFYTSQQRNVAAVVASIRGGCDGMPPLYALILHAVQPVLGNSPLVLRLPSVIGFCVMSLCVFAFVKLRYSIVYAAMASAFTVNACLPGLPWARSYGLVLACASGALLAWRSAAEGRHRRAALVALALCLGFATALHYYAVFLTVPFVAGETVRWYRSRKMDLPMLAAMAAAPLALLLHWPLLRADMRAFVARTPPEFILQFYWFSFFRFALILLAGAAFAILWEFRLKSAKQTGAQSRVPAHEWACLGVLTLMPLVLTLASWVTATVVEGRYVAWSAIGLGVLAAAALHPGARRRTFAGVIVLVLLIGILTFRIARDLVRPIGLREGETIRTVLAHVPGDPAPIVVAARGGAFLEAWFYADAGLRRRMVYLVNPELERRYYGSEGGGQYLSALRRWGAPIRLSIYEDFLRSTPRFLLAVDSGDWILAQLRHGGYSIIPLRSEAPGRLYLVVAPVTDVGRAAPRTVENAYRQRVAQTSILERALVRRRWTGSTRA